MRIKTKKRFDWRIILSLILFVAIGVIFLRGSFAEKMDRGEGHSSNAFGPVDRSKADEVERNVTEPNAKPEEIEE